jgi:2'-5' RNA ligase
VRVVGWDEDSVSSASFLAIVPPEPIAERIQAMQAIAGLDTSVLPHVTIKSQPGLQDPGCWRGPVRAALAHERTIDAALGPTGWFGSDFLYLEVHGALDQLHRRILACLEELGVEERSEYDGDRFVAHLTVGASQAGTSAAQLAELAGDLDRLALPRFTVSEVVEFRRTPPAQSYQPVGTYPLRQSSSTQRLPR